MSRIWLPALDIKLFSPLNSLKVCTSQVIAFALKAIMDSCASTQDVLIRSSLKLLIGSEAYAFFSQLFEQEDCCASLTPLSRLTMYVLQIIVLLGLGSLVMSTLPIDEFHPLKQKDCHRWQPHGA